MDRKTERGAFNLFARAGFRLARFFLDSPIQLMRGLEISGAHFARTKFFERLWAVDLRAKQLPRRDD